MSNNQLSLLARFDDFCRQTTMFKNSDDIDIAFLIKKTEENRIKWLQAETELRDAKKKIAQLIEQNHEFSNKLTNLRKHYGKEVLKSQNLQKENERFRAILDLVRKSVNDDIRGSKESIETASSGSICQMLSILNNPEQYLESRSREVMLPSKSFDEEELAFDKTDDSIDDACSNANTVNKPPYIRTNDTFEFITDIQKSVIHEKIPGNHSPSDHIEHDIRTDSEENCSQNVSIVQSICVTPNMYSTLSLNRSTCRKYVPTEMSRLDSRPHKMVNKKMYKSSVCNVCDKRIGFCSNARCCEDCKSLVHSQCSDKLPLPCIPHFSPRKRKLQVIGDFTSENVRPFVPAIVIYCCKEIENRGLQEENLYRIEVSERKVAEIKNKILKTRTGRPYLAGVDVHTLCAVLKMFFKELNEPIVTPVLWSDFIRTSCSSNYETTEDQEHALNRIINRLPDANRDTLAYFMLHLKRIVEQSKFNKMDDNILAHIFASTIIGYSSNNSSISHIDDNPKQIDCLKVLMNISNEFWSRILENPRFNAIHDRSLAHLNATNSPSALSRTSIHQQSISVRKVAFNRTQSKLNI